jgi:hypothetical protein
MLPDDSQYALQVATTEIAGPGDLHFPKPDFGIVIALAAFADMDVGRFASLHVRAEKVEQVPRLPMNCRTHVSQLSDGKTLVIIVATHPLLAAKIILREHL